MTVESASGVVGSREINRPLGLRKVEWPVASERVQKVLSRVGLASRREAEAWITAGRVTLNGQVCQLGDHADPDRDRIAVDGRPVSLDRLSNPGVVLAVHKPFGYVTTLSDPEGRRTIKDLLPEGERFLPIGRLDLASEGLLLCTNDGDLLQTVAHPSYGVHKVYRAWVSPEATRTETDRLLSGIPLEDGLARALSCRIVDVASAERGLALDPRRHAADAATVLEMTLSEGRRREVRRLLEALGLEVRRLVRIAVGPVRLTGLPPGRYRYLTEAEMRALVGLTQRRAADLDRRSQSPVGPRPGRGGPVPAGTVEYRVDRPHGSPAVRPDPVTTAESSRSGQGSRIPDRSHAKGGANT